MSKLVRDASVLIGSMLFSGAASAAGALLIMGGLEAAEPAPAASALTVGWVQPASADDHVHHVVCWPDRTQSSPGWRVSDPI